MKELDKLTEFYEIIKHIELKISWKLSEFNKKSWAYGHTINYALISTNLVEVYGFLENNLEHNHKILSLVTIL